MEKAIKEITIFLFICLVTILIFAILLYKYIPSKKNVPEIETYTATEDVQELLENQTDEDLNENNVILTYEVTASDLSDYQTTNTYVPGKSNPFEEISSETDNTESNTTTNTETNTKSNYTNIK